LRVDLLAGSFFRVMVLITDRESLATLWWSMKAKSAALPQQ
jgi:hypothetical protein